MKQVGHIIFRKGKIAFLFFLLSSLAVMGTAAGTSVTGKVQGDGLDGYLNHSDSPSQGSLRASSSNYMNNVDLEGVGEKRSLGSSHSCNYNCPSHSRRKRNRKCYDTFDDCYCYHGYYKKHRRCRRKRSSHSSDSSNSDDSSSKSKKSTSSSSSDSSDSKSSDKSYSHKSKSKKYSDSSDSYSYDKHHSKKYHHKSAALCHVSTTSTVTSK